MTLLSLNAVIKDLLHSLDISKEVLAAALGVNPRTVERWCAEDGTLPQKEARRRLEEMRRVQEHLYQTFGNPQAAQLWMRTDNAYLGGLKPVEVARAGRLDRLEAALTALDYGAFV